MANDIIITDGSRVCVNDLVIDGVITQSDINVSRPIVSHRTFSGNNVVAGKVFEPSGAISALNDYADDNWDEKLYGWISGNNTDVKTTIYAEGGSAGAGDRAWSVIGNIDSRSDAATVTDINMLNANINGEHFARGLCLDYDLTISGTAAQTGRNVGTTAATETFVYIIHCTAFSGTTFTVQVEESSDNGSGDAYAQITGTTITAYGNASAGTDDVTFTGTGWAIITKTGATEAWKRTNVTAATMTSSAVTTVAGKRH